MNDIDALTLRLLTSKKRYNSYLATANPDKSAEIQEYYNKVSRNKRRMKEIIGRYLDNPETETNNEIDDMFETCFKTLLKHFEMQDYEDKCAKHGYDATDSSEEEEEGEEQSGEREEEGEEEEGDEEGEEEGEEQSKNKAKPPMKTSFWGKTINKRSTTLDEFIVKK
jgi:hypothetical protein